MATLTHHIDRLKEKPSHVRERVAFGISGGVTALVAIGWLVAMSSSGAFSIATKSVANSVSPTADVTKSFTQGSSNATELLGAASAAFGGQTAASEIKVVDTGSTATAPASASSATVIPF